MPLRSYQTHLAGLRGMTRSTFEEITTKEPYKPLLEAQKRGSGRNNQGRISVRHRGGGEKQHYRIIDFKRDKFGVPAKLATIEYDPNRSARIGLLHYADGEKRYMLLPHGLKVGDVVVAGVRSRRGSAMRCRWPTSRSAPRSTTSSWCPARAARSSDPRAPRPSCSPKRATTPRQIALGRSPPLPLRCMATIGQVSKPRSREPEPGQGRTRTAHGPAARKSAASS